jgi:hypothetical protein|tara:strand:- start:11085 stop:12317 length:1233 start_codon:yes stop_codon:yes gene_type:complete
MAIPNGGLITETNEQYYAGVQGFISQTGAVNEEFTTTFDTNLVLGSFNPVDTNYALNNFKLYTSLNGVTYTEYILAFTVVDNVIKIAAALTAGTFVIVQLKSLTGGSFGQRDAFGEAVEDNYGSYVYTSLIDVVNNFIVGYVGQDKLIPRVNRTDVIFHAKRGLQEFSYDTLKSIKSQELTIPPSLSVIIPQDYVNYVRISSIDALGVKRIIYPANNLTISPYETPLQDASGEPTQDNFSENLEGTSITEERWANANDNLINGEINNALFNNFFNYLGLDYLNGFGGFYGRRYGLDPQLSQVNGWFNMNEREGKISFSSNLSGRLIVLEYISDGLAYDEDTKIPKLAEEALYAHIIYSILSTRINQPEYVVQRFKKERSSKLRNAKIRLSNIKLDEIVQVMRDKSKWIKH